MSNHSNTVYDLLNAVMNKQLDLTVIQPSLILLHGNDKQQ